MCLGLGYLELGCLGLSSQAVERSSCLAHMTPMPTATCQGPQVPTLLTHFASELAQLLSSTDPELRHFAFKLTSRLATLFPTHSEVLQSAADLLLDHIIVTAKMLWPTKHAANFQKRRFLLIEARHLAVLNVRPISLLRRFGRRTCRRLWPGVWPPDLPNICGSGMLIFGLDVCKTTLVRNLLLIKYVRGLGHTTFRYYN